ncbi:hypothetical protein D556_3500 [Bordetella holmesii 41130]|nr:hypothetical protein D556_3500 [Bordetella holmesii 41130]
MRVAAGLAAAAGSAAVAPSVRAANVCSICVSAPSEEAVLAAATRA